MRDPGEAVDATRRRSVTVAGHRGDRATISAALTDPDPTIRSAAIGAAARAGGLTTAELASALRDGDAGVRRRAIEVAAAGGTGPESVDLVLVCLSDEDSSVVEVAAWALGELGERSELPAASIAALAELATGHDDPLVREAAVASLGALGQPDGLAAILTATRDRPAVRRRAVLALAAFDGPEVRAALERASSDRDWQVRDAAELLLRDDG
jgi:HEAT repeat protein